MLRAECYGIFVHGSPPGQHRSQEPPQSFVQAIGHGGACLQPRQTSLLSGRRPRRQLTVNTLQLTHQVIERQLQARHLQPSPFSLPLANLATHHNLSPITSPSTHHDLAQVKDARLIPRLRCNTRTPRAPAAPNPPRAHRRHSSPGWLCAAVPDSAPTWSATNIAICRPHGPNADVPPTMPASRCQCSTRNHSPRIARVTLTQEKADSLQVQAQCTSRRVDSAAAGRPSPLISSRLDVRRKPEAVVGSKKPLDESRFVRAWAALAACARVERGIWGNPVIPTPTSARAPAIAERYRCRPSNSEAHANLGDVSLVYKLELSRARAAVARSVELGRRCLRGCRRVADGAPAVAGGRRGRAVPPLMRHSRGCRRCRVACPL